MKVEYSETSRRPQKKKRRKLSKVGKILVASGSILLIVAITVTLMLTVLFNVSAVKVVGSSVYSSDEIVYASGIMNGDNLFRLPSDEIVTRIQTALPYVKTVEIEKAFPNTVGIRVTPATESFLVEGENGSYIADADYKVLRSVAERPEKLLRIRGIETKSFDIGKNINFTDKQQKKILDDILKICDEKGISVQFVDIGNLVDICFLMDSRLYVKLGSYNELVAKMEHLAQTIKKINSDVSASISLENWSATTKEAVLRYEDISEFIK